MPVLGPNKRTLRFGVFELNTQSGELRRSGNRLKLGDQPARILLRMLEKPGEVITREELRELLWGRDTFVDFEHGLSAAINKLREVLGDSATNPRFIETIPRRGYRFLAEASGDAAAAESERARESSGQSQNQTTILPATTLPQEPSRNRSRQATAALVVASAVVIFLAGVLWISRRHTHPPINHPIRFEIPVPWSGDFPAFRLSPDGRYLAIAAGQLWIRPLDAFETRPVSGTEGATFPFWSPDSQSVGFFAQGKLKKISVTGGLAQTICESPTGRGGTWSRDGTIVFSPGPIPSPLFRVPASGGVPTPVTKATAGTGETHRVPEFLPDHRRFLFLSSTATPETSGVYAGSLDGTAQVRILAEDSSAVYAPGISGGGGHLLFRKRDNTLMAQPFDPERLQITAEALPIAEQVGISGGVLGFGAFSVSQSGVLAYQAGAARNRRFTWVDRTGKRVGVVPTPSPSNWPAMSPDEKTVVFTIDAFNGSRDLWLQDLKHGDISRFTFVAGASLSAIWSPDANHIGFYRYAGGQYEILRKPVSGSGSEERLARVRTLARPSDWSPDGRLIVFSQESEKTRSDLWILPLYGNRKPYPYLETVADEHSGQFSPDGQWMAYVSDESGQRQVYVQSMAPTGAKRQISVTGGSQPRWRRDGRELFYVAADEKLMAARIRIGSSGFEASAPQPLPGITVRAPFFPVFLYCPAANGQRFLVSEPVPGEHPRIAIVVNWQAGMER